jgi:hypothetical protein
MEKRQIDWFVEPLSAHTNEVIAKSLSNSGDLIEHSKIVDDRGIDHSVYQLSNYSFITRLYKDRRKFNLDFNVYSRQGKYGKIKLWTLGRK